MATSVELLAKLQELSDEEFRDFLRRFGGGENLTREEFVEYNLVRKPEHERLICSRLGLQTEDEKKTRASVEAAASAESSAKSARLSALMACLAVVIALAAFIFSAIALVAE